MGQITCKDEGKVFYRHKGDFEKLWPQRIV